jgi:hypothetical protein
VQVSLHLTELFRNMWMISGIWTRFLLNNRFAAIVDKKDLAYESQVLFAVENVAQFQVYPEAGLSFF